MVTIDVKDLEEHPAEVMRQVKSGETVQLVEGGRTVATITPVQYPFSEEQAKAFLAELERMAEEIGKYLPKPVDAVEAVREIRRDL